MQLTSRATWMFWRVLMSQCNVFSNPPHIEVHPHFLLHPPLLCSSLHVNQVLCTLKKLILYILITHSMSVLNLQTNKLQMLNRNCHVNLSRLFVNLTRFTHSKSQHNTCYWIMFCLLLILFRHFMATLENTLRLMAVKLW